MRHRRISTGPDSVDDYEIFLLHFALQPDPANPFPEHPQPEANSVLLSGSDAILQLVQVIRAGFVRFWKVPRPNNLAIAIFLLGAILRF